MGNLITKRNAVDTAKSRQLNSAPSSSVAATQYVEGGRSRSKSPSLSKKASLTEIIRVNPDGKPVEFTWKHGGSNVVITGSFDNWSQSIIMAKDSVNDMWRKTLLLNPNEQHEFKFIVDGVWRCSLDWETHTDAQGNVNNLIRSSS